MIDERERFDRAVRLFEMPEPAYDRMVERRDQRARTQRLTAAALGIAVVAVTSIFLVRSFGGSVTDRRPAANPDVARHDALGLDYTLPDGWMTGGGPHELILDAGQGRSMVVSRDVWAGPPGCVTPGSTGSGPRCKVGPGGIFAWLRGREALDVTTGIRPIGIDGFDTFRLELQSASGVQHEEPVLQRTGSGGRSAPVVSVGPGIRVGLYLIVTDRGTVAVSVVAPQQEFDAFRDAAERILASFRFDR